MHIILFALHIDLLKSSTANWNNTKHFKNSKNHKK